MSCPTATAWPISSRCWASSPPKFRFSTLPAWDCLPYDRVSPSADTSARRLAALGGLIAHRKKPHAAIVLVTANAMLQKVAPQDVIESLTLFGPRRPASSAWTISPAGWSAMASSGSPTVREVGEYAVRGGILDVFVPDSEAADPARFLRRYA